MKMFELKNLKIEKTNTVDIMADLSFKVQRDWKDDNNYTEYIFHGTNTKGLSRKNINTFYKFFKPDKMYIYKDESTSLADRLLIGFVYRKDIVLPEITKFLQHATPVEPEIATESNWGEPVEVNQSKWNKDDQEEMK